MDENSDDDDDVPMMTPDAELNQLLGLFDVPAFVRRGQDLEYSVARLHERCRRERGEMLEMVRLRLRQWTSAADGPDAWSGIFTAAISALWPLCQADPPSWAVRLAPPRRRRAIARDMVASIARFNRRWTRFVDELGLDHANRLIEDYNRYYLLEKECSLGSARLAARHFTPKSRLSADTLLTDYPLLPLPELAP